MATPTKAFRFTPGDLDRLARLKTKTDLNDTDLVRLGLALVEELLLDGLESSTQRLKDDRRLITIRYAPGRTVTFAERKNGAFYVGGWSGAAIEPDNPWVDAPNEDQD